MDIRDDQKVLVYQDGVAIYDGLWENASEEIKNSYGDWFDLADYEYADIVLILP